MQDTRERINSQLSNLEKLVQEKGLDWAVAALVDGSLGYYSPRAARLEIQRFLSGETHSYSERCSSCYGGDLAQMLAHDFRVFLYEEHNNPKRVQRIIERITRWASATLDTAGDMTVSAIYPTLLL